MSSQLTDLEQARAFALAGNARLTLVSKRTGERRTFRVSVPLDERRRCGNPASRYFVSVLTGPDNEADYRYMCLLVLRRGTWMTQPTQKSWGLGSTSYSAFQFFVKHVLNGNGHDQLEVWHEGRCGRCGRALTVPESIENGLGPVCAGL